MSFGRIGRWRGGEILKYQPKRKRKSSISESQTRFFKLEQNILKHQCIETHKSAKQSDAFVNVVEISSFYTRQYKKTAIPTQAAYSRKCNARMQDVEYIGKGGDKK